MLPPPTVDDPAALFKKLGHDFKLDEKMITFLYTSAPNGLGLASIEDFCHAVTDDKEWDTHATAAKVTKPRATTSTTARNVTAVAILAQGQAGHPVEFCASPGRGSPVQAEARRKAATAVTADAIA